MLSTPDILKEFPNLLELHLECQQMEIQPATPTIVFFHDQARLKACLNVRGSSQSLFTTCDIWEEAYEQLDRELSKPKPDWRPYRPWGSRGR